MDQDRIADLEVLLGYSFRDKTLLLNSLAHSSVKSDELPSNERMEFLGDAVLGLVLSDALYRRFADEDEGVLTRIKSQAVSRSTLQRVAAAMALDRFIMVGKGVRKRTIPASLLGNLFEALVGAIYLDTGLASARKFILRHLDVVVNEIVEDRAERNYKSLLQQYCQREQGTVPVYKVSREGGPPHSRVFEVCARIHGKEWGRARAGSKKEAEQGAARAALIHLKAVDESPRDSVRGAGTVLPTPGVSAEKSAKRKPSRSRRRGGRPKAAPAPEASAQGEAPARKKARGRGRKKAERKKKQQQQPGGPEQQQQPRKATSGRRRRRSRKSSSARKADSAAQAGGDAAS
jgi:ribonuclease-3